MIASETGSTNADVPDKTPLVPQGILRRISNIFSRDDPINSLSNDGGPSYFEFGTFSEESSTRTLGSFAGVFAPVCLSMFSALIFLRIGYIVGNAGLLVTLGQFVIAYGILIFTVMSVCAISTNGAVEVMISRTLGPEFGGSIGTLFFFANIVSSALCISGCVEGLVENFGPSGYFATGLIPDGRWWQFLYCTCLNVLNLIICLIGASMFAKTTVFILVLVCGCLGITFGLFILEEFIIEARRRATLNLELNGIGNGMEVSIPDSNMLIQNLTYHVKENYTGLRGYTLESNLWPQYGRDYTAKGATVTFSTVFGVLFSGVTGIMAGANMSGELKNPGKSIPRGTLSAVAFTFVTYIAISLLTAATCTKELIQNDYLFMIGISVLPPSVAIGLLTATWSAALSNVIGGSRVLEALAKDRIFWASSRLVLLIGSLNVIAQLNSVLFLLSYLATNLACLGLELAGAPNFRPSFMYFTWYTALIGLLGTIIMMFVISPIYASCSILLCLLLVMFLHLFSPSTKEAQWGSISQALIFHQVRKYLLLLDSRKDHVKFWRPQMLLLVNSPRSACPLIDFINDLKKGGLYVLGHVIIGETSSDGPDPTLNQNKHWLNLIDHLKVKAFVELTVAKTVREGLQHLMRLSGMGAMKPNTVVLGFLDDQEPQDFLQSNESVYQNQDFNEDIFPLRSQSTLEPLEYAQMMRDVLRLNKNLCLCRNFFKLKKELKSVRRKQYIDVWPLNFLNPGEQDAFDTTSLFMMQLACIVNMVPLWSKLKLRICICDEARTSYFSLNSSTQSHADKLCDLLKRLRIDAELFPVTGWRNVIESHGSDMERYTKSVNTLILQQTEETAVTFIYLPPPPPNDTDATRYYNYLEIFSRNLPPTIFVHGVSTVTSTTL
ncbi:hypothetical protein NQ315_013966 [Exocentrus adspersus]|uniref:Solute carrier family 12 member 9 n=1 Tax=Exocentrus adspersus TaxID=1586481 RepID=A0AAV8VS44_9CUCU|nr:hypothetical protein NQ315_013966 [Exocentrus adspersus]